MRFKQFNENSALEKAALQVKKNFSDERKVVQDEVNKLVRMVQMGKGDKLELARALTALTKTELQAKAEDPDLKYSVDLNIGMMKRAMDTMSGMNESITEEEIEEYKSLSSLRNDSMFRAMARIQNKNKKNEPKVIEIPKGTQLDLFKKANEGSTPYDDDEEMNAEEEQFVDMVVDYYAGTDEEGNINYSGEHMRNYDSEEMERAYSIAGGDPSDSVGRSNFLHREITQRLGLSESVEESLTEEQFDEAAGEKDACYRKVKSRYKVWPSAYASGALTKCRKVGAANWGNSKKK